MIWTYVRGRCCMYNRRSRVYILSPISDWEYSIPCHWRLFVIITTLLRSMEGTYHGQMCIAMLVAHLVLSVLAALVMYVPTCMCIVVLGVHLVLSVLAALWHMWCLYVCVDSENVSILCKS